MTALRLLLGLVAGLCTATAAARADGEILAFDKAALAPVLSDTAVVRELAHGFTWAEGPSWDRTRGVLYFSDVPENKAYLWSPSQGVNLFLDPSGLRGGSAKGFREPGSNGLLMTPDGALLVANGGMRAVERLSLDSHERTTIADRFHGRRFNSPNDMVLAADGTLYFTDPPYGLEGLNDSPLKEQPQNGVYQVKPGQAPVLVDGSLSFPNGIALSPDGQTLYVSVSDPAAPRIYRYAKGPDGFADRKVFFDAKPYLDKGWPGLPDGMTVAASGHLFASGPGGIFILTPEGKAIGLIKFDKPAANCTFGLDGRTLFITSSDRLLAVETKVKGIGWHDR